MRPADWAVSESCTSDGQNLSFRDLSFPPCVGSCQHDDRLRHNKVSRRDVHITEDSVPLVISKSFCACLSVLCEDKMKGLVRVYVEL